MYGVRVCVAAKVRMIPFTNIILSSASSWKSSQATASFAPPGLTVYLSGSSARPPGIYSGFVDLLCAIQMFSMYHIFFGLKHIIEYHTAI